MYVVRSYVSGTLANFRKKRFSDLNAARAYYAQQLASLPSCYEITIKRYGRYINEIDNDEQTLREWIIANVIPEEEDQIGHFSQFSAYTSTPDLVNKAKARHYSFI